MTPKLVTLVYCVKAQKVLLAKRNKPPFVGHWVAPGGKIELGESPYEGALRELSEETGLHCDSARLRAIVSETSQRDDWQWLIFVYRVDQAKGEICSDQREGELRWFDLDALASLHMPQADRHFVPIVLSDQSDVLEVRYQYDNNLKISDRFVFKH